MNITKFYLPILKSKAGEFDALYKLTPLNKNRIVPLFEVTRLTFDHETNKVPKTLEEHLTNFCKKVVTKWPLQPAFLDTHFIDTEQVGNLECIEYIYAHLAQKNIYLMPIVRTSTKENLLETITDLVEKYSIEDIGIRVTTNDIMASDFNERLAELPFLIGKTAEDCHLILDLADSKFTNAEDFSDGILDYLQAFPNLFEWQSLTLVGGAFPGMGKIKTEWGLIPREDWKFYKHFKNKLDQQTFSRPINYGDYSIVSPANSEFDPKKMSVSANIRYTHDEHWLVVKGRALKERKDWQQFFEQAKKISESDYFFGEHYSDGDSHIKRCAERKTTTGNANTWIKVGSNHHFTKVINDLFAMNL